MSVPEMFCLPRKTSSARLLHSPAPLCFDEREPSLLKLYSHGSRRYVGSFVAQNAVSASGTRMNAHGQRAVARETKRIAGPLEPSCFTACALSRRNGGS